jgi:hypothetical protein
MSNNYRQLICTFILQNCASWEDRILISHEHNMTKSVYTNVFLTTTTICRLTFENIRWIIDIMNFSHWLKMGTGKQEMNCVKIQITWSKCIFRVNISLETVFFIHSVLF